MALTITAVPDIKYVWGESGRAQANLFQPGPSDYVNGGYPITASAVELGKLVGASLLLTNPAGAAYSVKFVAQTSPISQEQTQINLEVYSGTTQVAPSTDLSGASWTALVIGW